MLTINDALTREGDSHIRRTVNVINEAAPDQRPREGEGGFKSSRPPLRRNRLRSHAEIFFSPKLEFPQISSCRGVDWALFSMTCAQFDFGIRKSKGKSALRDTQIKFGTVEAVDEGLTASLEALAALGARLGSPYGLGAAHILQRLEATAAARLRRRNAALVELRHRWYPEASNNKAAFEISRELMRYEASGWLRRDAQLSEPPPSAIGTVRELQWRALKDSEGGAPGPRRLRQIFAASVDWQQNALPIANQTQFHLGLDTPGHSSARSSFLSALPNVELIVREMPGFKEAANRAQATAIAERQAHLDAIAKLDAGAMKEWPRQEKTMADSLAKEQDAHRAFRAAAEEHQRVLSAVKSVRMAYERDRGAHEAALIAGDWPEISEFFDTCDREVARAKAAHVSMEQTPKNPLTGRVTRITVGNGRSVSARLVAIYASMREAPQLKMIADRRQLPAAIAEIVESWPAVQQPRAPEDLPRSEPR